MLIPAKICDAETTLSKDTADQVLILQHGSHGKLVGKIFSAFIIAAVFTKRTGFFGLHTAET